MCEGYPDLSVELREEESTYLFTEPEKSDCVFSTGKTACTVKVARPKTIHIITSYTKIQGKEESANHE